MKVLKIGVFAMALGFFAVSCSNKAKSADNASADSTQVAQPATTDSTAAKAAAPATTDSTAAKAAAPAATKAPAKADSASKK